MNQDVKVLIVEDDPLVQKMVADRLATEGYQILLASDGVEGLKTALSVHPDIVLLDIVMPNMDGHTMLENLRKNPVGKEIPVIILTSQSGSSDISSAMNEKVAKYFIKSNLDPEELVKLVKSLINTKI